MPFETTEKTETITIKETKLPITCWRLIHDNVRVIKLFRGNGKTRTPHELFAGTLDECEAEIARLNLEYKEKLQ